MAVARHFNYQANVIVPNVWWGMGLNYEADIVVLRPSGYAVEVEIKLSAADIVADTRKRHQHDSRLFCELWFAVPEALSRHLDIPAKAGILAVVGGTPTICRIIRKPKRDVQSLPWPEKKRRKLLELGVMRIWGLKESLLQKRKELSPHRKTGTD